MDFGQIEIEFWTTESPLGSHREGFFMRREPVKKSL